MCETRSDVDFLYAHLGFQPQETRQQSSKEAGDPQITHTYIFHFDSPKGAEAAKPTERLLALADAIEPFGERLLSLDTRFRRWVGIDYQVAPPRSDVYRFECVDLYLTPALMRRFAAWNLNVNFAVEVPGLPD